MYWFIILFPLLIYPWGPFTYYTFPKVFYLDMFVLFTWLYLIVKKKYWTSNLSKSELKIEFIVLIFMCLIGISTVFSVDFYSSFYGTETRFEGLVTFFSYCSILLFSYRLLDVKKIENLLKWMAFVSIFVSIYGILQHYSLDFFPRNISKLNEIRSFSFFDNANFYGSYLVLIILLTITLYLVEKSRKLLTLYLTTICINFIALIFSETRSGWVGLACGIIFLTIFAVVKRRHLWLKWTTMLIALGLIFILINLVEDGKYSGRLASFFLDSYNVASHHTTGHEGSARMFIWKESFPLIHSNFWLGSGPDTFKYVFPAKPEELEKYYGTSNIIVDKAHNEYLQIAVTLGIPALLIYLTLLCIVLGRAFKAVKIINGKEKLLLYGLISVIIGYLIQAFFNISTVPVAPLFWATIGITLSKAELHLNKKNNNNSLCTSEEIYRSA